MIRYYLIPLVIVPPGRRTAKYIDVDGAQWAMMDYGRLIDTGLIVASVTQAEHDQLSAKIDVTAIPQNLDNEIDANITAVRTSLEDLKIPGNWAQTGTTYRELLRMIGGLFQFAQRHYGLHKRILIPESINLNQTWSELAPARQAELNATATSFKYDTSGVTGSTTIRVILKDLADQWGNNPLIIGGIAL